MVSGKGKGGLLGRQVILDYFYKGRTQNNEEELAWIVIDRLLKEEPAEEQQAQDEYHRIDYNFDKTHLNLYA
jgi:hypothetical protein